MSNHQANPTDQDDLVAPNPNPNPPPLQQTPTELAASFYSAYETALTQYLRNSEEELRSEMLRNDDNLSLEESLDDDDDDEEYDYDELVESGDTSSSFLSDDREDEDEDGSFFNRTTRQIFPPSSNVNQDLHQHLPEFHNINNNNLSSNISMHAVNSLGIIKRYLPEEDDSFRGCQYVPRRDDAKPLNFAEMASCCPLQALNPDHFDCRTKVIVIIRDKRSRSWGSHWTTLLLNALSKERITSMCFTLRSQSCVNQLNAMLECLGGTFQSKMNEMIALKNANVEKFVAMSTLAKIFQYWSVPIMLIDYAPKRALDYKSILAFARKFNIKVMTFGFTDKSIGAEISGESALSICRSKASEIVKVVGELYEQEFRVKMKSGYYSMQAVRCVRNPGQVCEEVNAEILRGTILNDELKGNHDNLLPDHPPTYACINASIPNAFNDWNEWLEWEQPYYDMKDEFRRKINENILDLGKLKPEKPDENRETIPITGEDGGSESSTSGMEFPFHQLIHGDVDMPTLIKTQHETRSISNIHSNKPISDTSSTETISSPDSSDHDEETAHIWRLSNPAAIRNPFQSCNRNNNAKKKRPFVRYAKRRMEMEELKEQINTPAPAAPSVDNLVAPLESSTLASKELEELQNLQIETRKNFELRRLRKYFQKMNKDYKNMLQKKEPDSYKDFDLAEKYSEGRSCCLEMKEDEWALYKKPINDVLSPYDIQYLQKDFTGHDAHYKMGWMETTMQEATSLFIDTIIQVCCGSRILPGRKESRKTIKTMIFVNDNPDVLDLLTGALWFAGKTAVASCQRNHYDNDKHRYFGASLTACKSYAGRDLKDEELYLTWITIGLNQVLKQDDIKFVIVDFPRPGKALTKVFKAMIEKLQTEKSIRGIETLYVSKCMWRGDNLATVENVLDQLQDRMDPEDRIIFRKSRKMYLDFRLTSDYEDIVKKELVRQQEWGLPPPELMSTELWESIRLHEMQMCCKKVANNSNDTKTSDDAYGDFELYGDMTTNTNTTNNLNDISNDNPSPPQVEIESQSGGDSISDNNNYNGGESPPRQNFSSSEDDEGQSVLHEFQSVERLERELDILEQMGTSGMDCAVVRNIYRDFTTEQSTRSTEALLQVTTTEIRGETKPEIVEDNPEQRLSSMADVQTAENSDKIVEVLPSQETGSGSSEVVPEIQCTFEYDDDMMTVNVESPLAPPFNKFVIPATDTVGGIEFEEIFPSDDEQQTLSNTLEEVTSYLLSYEDNSESSGEEGPAEATESLIIIQDLSLQEQEEQVVENLPSDITTNSTVDPLRDIRNRIEATCFEIEEMQKEIGDLVQSEMLKITITETDGNNYDNSEDQSTTVILDLSSLPNSKGDDTLTRNWDILLESNNEELGESFGVEIAADTDDDVNNNSLEIEVAVAIIQKCFEDALGISFQSENGEDQHHQESEFDQEEQISKDDDNYEPPTEVLTIVEDYGEAESTFSDVDGEGDEFLPVKNDHIDDEPCHSEDTDGYESMSEIEVIKTFGENPTFSNKVDVDNTKLFINVPVISVSRSSSSIHNPSRDLVQLISQVKVEAPVAVVESENESIDSESDHDFVNLMKSEVLLSSSPVPVEISPVREDRNKSEEEKVHRDFEYGVGWCLKPRVDNNVEAEEKDVHSDDDVKSSVLITQLIPILKMNPRLRTTPKVTPESLLSLIIEDRPPPKTSRKKSLVNQLGVILSSPFRIILNFFRK